MSRPAQTPRFTVRPLAALTLAVCALIMALTGCGGGDNHAGPPPTAPPPSGPQAPPATNGPTSPPPVTGTLPVEARAFVAVGETARDETAARVRVDWQAPADIPAADIVEYHVYRDEQIIGVNARANRTFIDDASLPAGRTLSFLTSSLIKHEVPVAPFTVGVPHTYRVTALYRYWLPFTGNVVADQPRYEETGLWATSGTVTPLTRPGANGTTGAQNMRELSVFYQTVRAGDSYVLEFAATPAFSEKTVIGPFTATYQDAFTISAPHDLGPIFPDAAFPAKTIIYYRVGVRASGDALPPLSADVPNGDNYIYSARELFTKY